VGFRGRGHSAGAESHRLGDCLSGRLADGVSLFVEDDLSRRGGRSLGDHSGCLQHIIISMEAGNAAPTQMLNRL